MKVLLEVLQVTTLSAIFSVCTAIDVFNEDMKSAALNLVK